MPPKKVAVTHPVLPAAVLVDVEGPWRIIAEADAAGLVNLGEGRKATLVITLAELAAFLDAIPEQAVGEVVLEHIRGVAKLLREA